MNTTLHQDDPWLWLEDVDSEQALAWVAERKDAAQAALAGDARYAPLRARLKAILDDKARIPYVRQHGGLWYNFWRDAEHPRGLWRRTTPQEYANAEPAWETVLDLDELAERENENWVWAGTSWLEPQAERCLLSLSRGGGDAHVVREFDLAERRFVEGGFDLPEAKSSVAWIDRDRLFVATDIGAGSMTESGYPRIVKEWRRGTPLAQATVVFEAEARDLSASAWRETAPGFEFEFVQRQIGFYSNQLFLRQDGRLRPIPKPDDADAFAVRDQLVLSLRSDWQAGGRTWPQGALLAIGLAAFLDGSRDFAPLFAPTPTTSLDGVTATRDALLLTILDKVKNRIVELRRDAASGSWLRRDVAVPGMDALAVSAVDDLSSNAYFLTMTGFLAPSSLYLMEAGSDRRTPLKSMPAFFDAAPYAVEQLGAISKDGTAIPYFVVRRRDAPPDGESPTLLYGYGGFEVSLTPYYSGVTGAAWLEQGGVYVLANIRGGGEFGPGWHQAALGSERQRAFDDFIAVAEDLVARGITRPRHLGIMGGSNGGLLVGAVLAQRPELFNAVVCQVPLLDMRRYHLLLAGASWMGEYGDPDDPADWTHLARYSPYHNVHPERRYPRVLFTTSTRDDRVHPGHARKMAARMHEQGHDVLYWENTEGGHAGAANNEQTASMWALTYIFLLIQLKG